MASVQKCRLCIGGREVAVDLDRPLTHDGSDYEYFINILKLLARSGRYRDCNFVIVDKYDPKRRFSDDTVVLLSADERFSCPLAWANCALILRTYSNDPPYVPGAYGGLAGLVDALRCGFFRARNTLARGVAARAAHRRLAEITHEIPLGYCRSQPLTPRALADRPYLTFFAGSLSNRRLGPFPFRSPADFIKWSSRKRLIAQLKELARRRSDVRLRVTENFLASLEQLSDYSGELMATKVCVAPRGTAIESFRLFEAAKYGCVCVAEPLPDRWFYESAPVLVVEDWAELPALLESLADDPARLEALHRATLKWWKDILCEQAVAARVLGAHEPPASPPSAAKGRREDHATLSAPME